MQNITINFVGGSKMTLQECTAEFVDDIVKWLNSDSKETYTIDMPFINKTKILRKEPILFIDIE